MLRLRSKKGQETEMIGKYIYYLMVLVATIVVGYLLINSLLKKDLCKERIEEYATMADKFSGELRRPFPPECKPEDFASKNSQKENVKEEILIKLENCWDKMGGLEDRNVFGRGVFQTENDCFRCYNLVFPKLEGEINAEDFNSDILTMEKDSRMLIQSISKSTDNLGMMPIRSNINKEGKYAIVYVSQAKAQSQWKNCLEIIGTSGIWTDKIKELIAEGIFVTKQEAIISLINQEDLSLVNCMTYLHKKISEPRINSDLVYLIEITENNQNICLQN